jgi:hypothetical protein
MQRKEIVEAAVTSIEHALSVADKWALLFTALVVVGVAGELWVGWYHWSKDRKLAPLRAELSEILQSEIEVARADSAKSRLDLAKIKTPRSLSSEQARDLSTVISKFKGTRFDISAIVGDPEALALVGPMADALRNAGWAWIEFNHPNGPFMNVYSIAGLPNIGQVGTTGVSVVMHADHQAEFQVAAAALSNALDTLDIKADSGTTGRLDIPNHDTLHILIGRKPY